LVDSGDWRIERGGVSDVDVGFDERGEEDEGVVEENVLGRWGTTLDEIVEEDEGEEE
jgi:hypothetical protein